MAMTSTTLSSWRRRLLRCDRGTLVTELVVTMPLLFIFLFGLIGMGQLLWFHHIVTQGVRDGVRFMSRMPFEQAYIDQAIHMARTGTTSGGRQFFFWTNANSVAVNLENVANPSNTFRGPDPITVVRMTATVNVSIGVFGFGLLGMNPAVTYTVTDRARWIGG
jgi:TadE-like protein